MKRNTKLCAKVKLCAVGLSKLITSRMAKGPWVEISFDPGEPEANATKFQLKEFNSFIPSFSNCRAAGCEPSQLQSIKLAVRYNKQIRWTSKIWKNIDAKSPKSEPHSTWLFLSISDEFHVSIWGYLMFRLWLVWLRERMSNSLHQVSLQCSTYLYVLVQSPTSSFI